MTFYEGTAFGPKYQNQILHCDAGPREIRCYTPQRMSGVGFTAGIQNIVTNTDPYFRPVDPCVAPDGSIYVTDWYDGGVGGHAYNDPDRGRIYRIVPKGKKLVRQHKAGPYTNDADALAALGSPNHATLWHARERLLQSGQAALAGLTQLASGADRTLKARALWLLDRIGGEGRTVVQRELASTDPTFRALAVRILRRHGEATLPELLPFVSDADGEVSKEALLAAGASPSPAATAAILKAWSKYDGSDRYLLETLGIASRNRQAEVFQKVVAQATGDVTPRLIDIARILRPEDASKYLAGKLASAGVNEKSAEAILTALSSVASSDAGKEIVKVLGGTTPIGTRRLALASLQRNLSGAWKNLRETPELQKGLEESLKTPELVPAALGVIAEAGLTPLADQVVQIIGDKQASEASRVAAIAVASRLQIEKAGPVQAQLLRSTPAVSEALQKSALDGLVALRDTASAGKLLAADSGVTTATRERLVDGLMQSSDGAVFLMRSLDTGKLAQPLAKRAIAAAVEHPDVNVRLLFEKHIPADQRPKTLGQQFKAEDILKLDGNVDRGAQVFARSGAAACSKCYRVKGQGADVGPELSQIGRKYEKKALLETIMNPSAGIAPEYYPYVVETDTGKVFAGFLKESNDEHVLLKSIEGNLVDLPRSKVVELVKQEKSLMPELVLQSVTAQDAADLLAYLANLQEAIVPAASFQVLGPFPNVRPEQRGQDFGPEAKASEPDLKAQHATFGMKQIGWRRVDAKVGAAGVPQLDIRQLSGAVQMPADNVLYYFAVVAESASSQPATLHIGSDDGVQVWVNGKKVHDNKVTRALAPAQDKVPVELKQGRNVILLKVDQGNGDAGAILAVEAKANVTLSAP
jgi:putative heme-binding domain-containing protein